MSLLLLAALFLNPQEPVVNNPAPLWKKGQEWTVGAKPLVDIGQAEGEPEYEIAGVSGVVRMRDGRIAVANMQANEIRFYDRNGKFINKVGRRGEGPGEFRQLMSLRRLAGDSLVADDSRFRNEFFSPQGSYVRQLSLSTDYSVSPLAWFRDGSFVAGNSRLNTGPTQREGEWADSMELTLHDVAGKRTGSIGKVPFLVMARRPNARSAQPLEFTPRMSMAAGDVAYVGFSDDYSIGVYAKSGQRIRTIRRAWTPVAVGKKDLDNFKESFVSALNERQETNAEWRAFREKRFGEMNFAEKFPAFGMMMVDEVGNLWVQEYQRPVAERGRPSRFFNVSAHPLEWSVFSPQGRWLGQVFTPANTWVFEIGADYITGVTHDQFDVEHARVYPLIKPR